MHRRTVLMGLAASAVTVCLPTVSARAATLNLLATTYPVYQLVRNIVQGVNGVKVNLLIPAGTGTELMQSIRLKYLGTEIEPELPTQEPERSVEEIAAAWREGRAEKLDIPRKWVMSDEVLVALVKVEASRRPSEHHRLSLSDFIEPRLIPFSLLGCFVCLAWGNLQAFIAGYAHEYGVVAAASSFFLVYAVAILVSRPWSGKMYDMHGPAVIMYPAFVCLVLAVYFVFMK